MKKKTKKLLIKLANMTGLFFVFAIGIFGFSKYDGLLMNERQIIKTVENREYVKAELSAEELSRLNDSPTYVLGASVGEATSIPVLLYHGIVSDFDKENVTLNTFKEQMIALKKAGYQTISIKDFYDFVKGNKSFPDKSFLLTFDDGRKDSYYPVDSLLKSLNYRAVMYVITASSFSGDSSYYLNKDELIEMYKSGRWDIESHGKLDHYLYKTSDGSKKDSHYLSNLLWLESEHRLETIEEFRQRISQDLNDSKEEINEIVGNNVISFAYPFGDYGQSTENFPESKFITPAIASTYYPITFTQSWSGQLRRNYPDSERSLFKRINVGSDWDADKLVENLNMSRDKKLPFYDKFETNLGWQQVWGNVEIGNQELTLSSSPNTSGAYAILDGTYLWRNVSINATVKFVNDSTVSIMARDNDEGESVRCSFSNNSVTFRVYQNNTETRRITTLRDSVLVGKRLGMEVDDKAVRCLVNNVVVLDILHRGEITSNGRVGFGTWTAESDMSKLILDDVTVSEINEE